jgi:hypothetical protein
VALTFPGDSTGDAGAVGAELKRESIRSSPTVSTTRFSSIIGSDVVGDTVPRFRLLGVDICLLGVG